MKVRATFIEDFSVLSKEDLCENCSKQDTNRDGLCRDCYTENFKKLLHPDMVKFVKQNKEITPEINRLFFILNDAMHDNLCNVCSLKDLSKKVGNDLCDICFRKEIAYLFARDAVSRGNDINKLLDHGETLVSAHSAFSLFRCFIELFCLYFVVISDTPTARKYEKDKGKNKRYIKDHPQMQSAAKKHKGNFNFKEPGERELRYSAGEILNSYQQQSQNQQFNIDLLNQQYDYFCLYNHTSMRGMDFWGTQFETTEDSTELKDLIRHVLSDVSCFSMMILSNALSVCLSAKELKGIENDIISVIDKINGKV